MASRTRERLIDVARQLFARQGIENTTMNDIATASDRGRRTLYTYFRTKSDIYQAVLEAETVRISQELESTVAAEASPAAKLRALIQRRLDLVIENAPGYEVWLRSLFSRDMKRARKVRDAITRKIYEMIDRIVADGIASGDFIPQQANRLIATLTIMLRGTEWWLTHDFNPELFASWRVQCVDFIIDAISRPDSNNNLSTNSPIPNYETS